MQPKQKLQLNSETFGRLKQSLKLNVQAQRLLSNKGNVLPQILGIKLTNRCNLRCSHCYQWNKDGYHRDMEKNEQLLDLDIEIFKQVLSDTRCINSRLYLWGGEPLFHRDINQILTLLQEEKRETIICTNAHYLHEYIHLICRISENLELLIAVEGFESQHDGLRGAGSFSKVMGAIDELILLRQQGIFKGKISIHCVINDGMVNRLYELMEFFEAKGVDLVLLCFPWFISETTSQEMDDFVSEKFAWLVDISTGPSRHTWDAFKYHISPLNIDPLIADLARINAKAWGMRLRYQPGLEVDEIEPFVRGITMSARCATQCSVLQSRVDIMPNGKVSACKFFSEFLVGDLHASSLEDIWKSTNYARIRQTFSKGLSPACSKCNVLYLQEHSVPTHI